MCSRVAASKRQTTATGRCKREQRGGGIARHPIVLPAIHLSAGIRRRIKRRKSDSRCAKSQKKAPATFGKARPFDFPSPSALFPACNFHKTTFNKSLASFSSLPCPICIVALQFHKTTFNKKTLQSAALYGILSSVPRVMTIGSRAASCCESCQGRKAAALNRSWRAPRGMPDSSPWDFCFYKETERRSIPRSVCRCG